MAAQMIGRDREIDWLVSFSARATAHGGAAVVTGEPGIGKTMLLDVVAGRAAARGVQVLRSSGVEFETDLGFSGLHQMLLPLLHLLGELPGAQHQALEVALGLGAGTNTDRMLVSTAALAVLKHGVTPHGAFVVVDDAQWLDQSSAEVIAFIARRLAGTRVCMVVACRSGSGTLFERSGLDELEVRPLADDDAAKLVDERFPTLAGRVRRRLVADAGGNPLALLELPSVLTGEQRAATRPLPDILPLTERLTALFATRLEALSKEARRFLLLVALDSRRDLRARLVTPDLAAAEDARLVHVDAVTGRVAFRHPLVRAAIVEFATTEERREAHFELAELSGARTEERAWHLAAAADGTDEEVAALLEAAARQMLQRGDAATAVAALTRAAQLSPSPVDHSRRVGKAALVEAHVSGDTRHITSLLDEAQSSRPGPTRSLGDVAAEALLLLNRDGDITNAARLLSAAITDPDNEAAQPDERELAIWALHPVCVYTESAQLWRLFESQVDRFKASLPPVLSVHAVVGADPARVTSAELANLDRALVGLESATDPLHITTLAAVASCLDRASSCREPIARLLRHARGGGAATLGISNAVILCRGAFDAGEWDAVDQLVDDGLLLCEGAGARHGEATLLLFRALVAGARGDAVIAEELVARAAAWMVPRGNSMSLVHWARCTAASARGDFEAAYREAAAISPPGSFAPYVPRALAVPLELVEAAVRTGRREQALAHARAMQREDVGRISPRLAMISGASAAMASDLLDEELFEQALAVRSADRWPFARARVQLAFGERLRRDLQPTKARDQLAGALDTFDLLKATPWAERARSELRAAGVGTPHSSRPLARGLELTSQEREIAVLASEGLSNREIAARLYLSPRTVGAHLYRIFPKLGITSRSALRRALDDLGPPEPR
jgi:DNA-binding CsgD family transcriptional regulator